MDALEKGTTPNVQLFLRELASKMGACRAWREAVLLEWGDEALARLVATSSGTSRLCFHAGENRLVVLKESLAAFGRAVKKLGYVLPNRG